MKVDLHKTDIDTLENAPAHVAIFDYEQHITPLMLERFLLELLKQSSTNAITSTLVEALAVRLLYPERTVAFDEMFDVYDEAYNDLVNNYPIKAFGYMHVQLFTYMKLIFGRLPTRNFSLADWHDDLIAKFNGDLDVSNLEIALDALFAFRVLFPGEHVIVINNNQIADFLLQMIEDDFLTPDRKDQYLIAQVLFPNLVTPVHIEALFNRLDKYRGNSLLFNVRLGIILSLVILHQKRVSLDESGRIMMTDRFPTFTNNLIPADKLFPS